MGKMKNLLRKNYPFVIIILVSFFAFAAGYTQNIFVEKADAFSETAGEHEYNAMRIEQRLRTISNNDATQMFKVGEKSYELVFLAIEYTTVESTLTEIEKEIYRLDFAKILMERSFAVYSTTTYSIHKEFTETSNQEYIITEESSHGFDYIIERDDWQTYTPLFLVTRNTLFTQLGLYPTLQTITDDLDFYIQFDKPDGGGSFWQFDFSNAGYLLQIPFQNEVVLQLENTDKANTYQSIADQITIGVSVTTIATVLSTAMASRLESKKSDHEISVLRADIIKDPSVIKTEKDKLAIIGLTSALVIAALGLLLPIFLLIFNL